MIALIVALSLTLIHFLNLGAILVMIFRRREEPIFIIAWTMLMMFVPLIGFILYLLFGHGPIVKEKRTFVDEIEQNHHESNVANQMERFKALD
ncbi:cardiolipin synthase, partial [Turicibacter sanguinis]|nr:cardiolipin synthase [Turicibacter sanguinis]